MKNKFIGIFFWASNMWQFEFELSSDYIELLCYTEFKTRIGNLRTSLGFLLTIY